MSRKELDFYETPPPLVEALINRVRIEGTVFEPCAGDLAIARFFPGCWTNDIDPKKETDTHHDAAERELWWKHTRQTSDWVITNPPFSRAQEILPHAFEWAEKGVAFLLRLSYLEPTKERGQWLHDHRHFLSRIIVFNPRPRFRRNKKGHLATDSVTVAWYVWEKSHNSYFGTYVNFVMGWNK